MINFLQTLGSIVPFLGVILLIAGMLSLVVATSLRSLFRISTRRSWVIAIIIAAGLLGAFWLYLTVPYSDNPVVKYIQPSPPYWVYKNAEGAKVIAATTVLFLAGLYYWINRKILPYRTLWTINISFTIFFGLFLFFYISILNPCQFITLSTFHYFNAHLKSLCIDRADKSECPQDEGALAGFNHQRWSELNQCSQVKYYFNAGEKQFSFQVSSTGIHIISNNL